MADLVPYARNARTHTPEQITRIAASIQEFGFTNPILCDGKRGVIAGHGRLLAAQELGMETVPTVELRHLTEAQRQAYVLADNRMALDAGWDTDLLASAFAELQDAGFDLALTGFTPVELGSYSGGDPTDPTAEWQGMPEFENPDVSSYRQLIVHFRDQAAVDQFMRLIGQPGLGPKVRSTWFPEREPEKQSHLRFVGPDAAEFPDLHSV